MKKDSRTKCGKCKNKLILFQHKCKSCSKYFHKKCLPNLNGDKAFICTACINKSLPFFKLQNLEFLDNLDDKTKYGNCPSFNIQSLLDELKRNDNENNEFMGETLKSTYYNPEDFINAKLNKNSFSIIHLNIASISAHLDKLISLISILKHDFDVITLSETSIKQSHSYLVNIEYQAIIFLKQQLKLMRVAL